MINLKMILMVRMILCIKYFPIYSISTARVNFSNFLHRRFFELIWSCAKTHAPAKQIKTCKALNLAKTALRGPREWKLWLFFLFVSMWNRVKLCESVYVACNRKHKSLRTVLHEKSHDFYVITVWIGLTIRTNKNIKVTFTFKLSIY
jgi:hypothetical protein